MPSDHDYQPPAYLAVHRNAQFYVRNLICLSFVKQQSSMSFFPKDAYLLVFVYIFYNLYSDLALPLSQDHQSLWVSIECHY